MYPMSLTEMIMTWEEDADQHLINHVHGLIAEDKATWVWDPYVDGVAALVIPDTNIALVVLYADGDWETSIDGLAYED